MADNADPLRYFRIEARDLAEAMGRDALRLEAAPSAELVTRLLRLAHTLKGAARVVKQTEIADRAHDIEETLAPLRDRPGSAPKSTIETLLRQIDAVSARVAALNRDAAPAVTADRLTAEESYERADSAELDALYDAIAETARQVRQARAALPPEIGRHELDQAERELEQARDAASKLRLVPASASLAALERTARDVAQSLGKEASFAATGGAIRLEARVLGALRGALIQLVRNAVAHGVEAPAERQRLGKPAAGCVTLEIARRGDRVAFVCADDGAGIDQDAVRRVARERGAPAAEVERLDAGGLVRLLLRGGISTAAGTSQVAGRGVGLDVVREAAARLGGEIAVETEPGKGTRVTLTVPVSLSMVEALLVRVGETVAALPVGAVRGAIRLSPGHGNFILHDGRALPLTPLRVLLPGAGDTASAATRVALLLAGEGGIAALAAEALLGVATLVTRKLPDTLRADPLIAGASLDADGVPRLVLDPERLVAAARAAPPAEAIAPAATKSPILVVDDSLTTRMLEQSILESAGFEVDLAVSAEDGLEKAARRRYGLFLVDVEMPGIDGFTFVARTRADAKFRDTPALLVSSRNGAEDRRRANEAGASGYIVKGEFDQGLFLDTIRRLVA